MTIQDQHMSSQKSLRKIFAYVLIALGIVLVFNAGFFVAQWQMGLGAPTPARVSQSEADAVSAEQSELRPQEKVSYQIIEGQQVRIYLDDEYGFDVVSASAENALATEEFPDLELDLERFLNKLEFFVDELDSLAVAVDSSTQRLYAALEIKESQALNAIFFVEADRFGTDFSTTAPMIQFNNNPIADVYTDIEVLGVFPSQKSILVRKSSGGIPCVLSSIELLYQDGTTKEIAETLGENCGLGSNVLLSFDGTYLYIAEVMEADDTYNEFANGAVIPRSKVTELYKLNPLTGGRVNSSIDFSEETWLVPTAADETAYGYHSSIFSVQHVSDQDTFLLPGRVLLERAETGENVFLEV